MNSDSSAVNVQTEGVAKSPENGNQQVSAILQKGDLEMVRVLDDLAYLLIREGMIVIIDPSPMAQAKLMNRASVHQELDGLK